MLYDARVDALACPYRSISQVEKAKIVVLKPKGRAMSCLLHRCDSPFVIAVGELYNEKR